MSHSIPIAKIRCIKRSSLLHVTFSVSSPVPRHLSVYLTRQTALGKTAMIGRPVPTLAESYEVTVTRRSESAADWIANSTSSAAMSSACNCLGSRLVVGERRKGRIGGVTTLPLSCPGVELRSVNTAVPVTTRALYCLLST